MSACVLRPWRLRLASTSCIHSAHVLRPQCPCLESELPVSCVRTAHVLRLCINKDTLVHEVFIPYSFSKIFTILLIEVLAIRKETIRFLAFCNSFPILILKFCLSTFSQPSITQDFWHDSFHHQLCTNYKYDLIDNNRYLMPTFWIWKTRFSDNLRRRSYPTASVCPQTQSGRAVPVWWTHGACIMDAQWTQGARSSDTN